MTKKILIGILALAIATIIYFVADVFFERWQDDTPTNTPEPQNQPNDPPPNNATSVSIPTNDDEEESNSIPEKDNRRANIDISRQDCNKDCTSYYDEDLTYCRHACGLEQSTESDSCESLDNLERDYCWKDQAIEKLDFSVCKKIEDKNIHDTCKNRITEDIVDQSKI